MSFKIGCLIIDLAGQTLQSEDRELLAHPLVGGVILFARNYDSPEQVKYLCEQIRATRQQPILITVDQEGGRVQRLIKQFTRIPPMLVFEKLYLTDRAQACERARDCAWLLAMELLQVGIDLSFTPVLDVHHTISHVIGDRAFAADPDIVSQLASSFVNGLQEAGMAAVGKHFPGHGSIALDSHVANPIDNRSFDEIAQHDLKPFIALIKMAIPALMSSHIIFPTVDDNAVTFSHRWLHDILRKQLGFTGTIFSDDLNMKGASVSHSYSDRVLAARDAGCDFTLLCNNREAVIKATDEIPSQNHQLSADKWQTLLGNLQHNDFPLTENKRWQKTHQFLLTLSQQTA